MAAVKLRINNQLGFTYLELITGLCILLLGFSSFMVIFRHFNVNKMIAQQNTMMATVAQNTAESYKRSLDAVKTIEYMSSEYPDHIVNLNVVPKQGSHLETITVTVDLRQPSEHVKQYRLVFYVLERNSF